MFLRKNNLAGRRDDFLFRAAQMFPARHRSAYGMVILFLAILGVGYIAFRSSTIFLVPALTLEEPSDGVTSHSSLVAIRGLTDAKTLVRINEYETYSNEDGKFAVELPFAKGFNIIDIRVKNRVGKEAKVVRHVVVE